MKRTFRWGHRRGALTVAVVALAIGGILAAGCSSAGQSVTGLPADHFSETDATAIDADHARCESCHEGLDATFECVSDGDLMQAHLDAWNAYEDGTVEDEGREIVENNLDAMRQYYGTDAEGKDCLQCHDTVVDENGGISVQDMHTEEFCTQCHDVETITEKTANWSGDERVNPHYSHLGVISCDNCHLTHGEQDIMYCDDCHAWGLPEDGTWESSPFKYSQVR